MALNQKVYFNNKLSFSPAICEAIQTLYLSRFENQYCAVVHARGLVCEGSALADVERLGRIPGIAGLHSMIVITGRLPCGACG
jgi:hypothetical protein